MSELQENQAVEQEVIEQPQGEQSLNDDAALAPASEEQHEQIQQEPELSANAQKAINKKHWEAKEAERRADEYKRQLEELQAQQQASQNVEPIVPPMPDSFDDNYETLMEERDKKLMERAQWKANQDFAQQQQQQIQQQQQEAQQRELNKSVQTYEQRAKDFGISTDELNQTGALVAQSGISQDLAVELLNDPEGALIVKQLASDVQALDELTRMTPFQAANYINQHVRPKAQNLKPKASSTPPPADTVSNKVVDTSNSKYKLTSGAKFE